VRSVIRFTLVLAALFTLAACATQEKALKAVEGSEDSKEGPTYLVGIIEMVNPEQQFVLIKAQPGIALPTGHTLTALDATGTLSELVISAERKASHVTADIKSGHPRVGNLVAYLPKNQTVPAPTGAPSPDQPASDGIAPAPTLAPLVPLSGAGTPYSGPPSVEWRDGQPPPFQPAAGATSQLPAPLAPLPEPDLPPLPTLPPVIE